MKFAISIMAGFVVWTISMIIGLYINIEDVNILTSTVEVPYDNISYISKLNNKKLFEHILYNNIKVCIINIFGALSLGAITISNIVLNGFNFGIFLNYFLKHYSFAEFFESTYRHSFEILGFAISGGIGIESSKMILKNIFFNIRPKRKEIFILISALVISFLIIAVAAYVEVFYSIKND